MLYYFISEEEKMAEKTVSDQSPKLRRSKSRKVSSRYLSPTSTSTNEGGIPSPNQALSPIQRKTTSVNDARKHRSLGEIGFVRGLWPSSTSSSQTSRSSRNKSLFPDTLADHLSNERLKDLAERRNNEKLGNNSDQYLSRQSSCSEFDRFGEDRENSKENHHPIVGGSVRYTGKLGKSSSSNTSLIPGRLSVDENALLQKSRRKLDSFADVLDSESDCSEISGTDFESPAIGKNSSFSSSTVSSHQSGIDFSSRYLNDPSTRLRRGTSDSNIPTPVKSENSNSFNNLPPKNAIKRVNSHTGYATATSQWALSPGRSASQPVSVENKVKPMSFSSLRPISNPSKGNGMGNLISLGLELFKSKKSSSLSSPVGPGIGQGSHQLRMLHCRLIQWRYVNSRAEAVNSNKTSLAESNLLNAWSSLSKLRSSVVQKRILFEKEKFDLKLNTIIHSQIKPLECWGDMERQHVLAVSLTKDYLHSVVCKVPLIEGAKVEPKSTSVALRHSADLAVSIKTILNNFLPVAQKTASLLSDLAEVVSLEKLLLEECFELLEVVSALEIQERSLRCNVIQMKSWQQQQQKQQVSLSS